MKEELGQGVEFFLIFGGQKLNATPLAAKTLHFGMTGEIVSEAASYEVALRYDAYPFGSVLSDFIHQNGIVSASEDNSVNLRISVEKDVNVFFDEIVSAGGVSLVVLYQWYPQRTGYLRDINSGV